jgi:hypothetical protein
LTPEIPAFFLPWAFAVKTQIPLNPLLLKGDFKPPLEKVGQGGFFIFGGEIFVVIDV